jgi:hypothetical protein
VIRICCLLPLGGSARTGHCTLGPALRGKEGSRTREGVNIHRIPELGKRNQKLRQNILPPHGSSMNSTRLIKAVDQIPDLRGAGIAYIGNGQCTLVRDSDHQSGLRTYVVFQQIERTGLSPVSAFPASTSRTAAPNQDRVASTVGTELRRAALDCGGVVFSAMLAGGSTVALPLTGGFSSVGLAIASSALVATSLRCGMSVGRLWNAGNSPDANRILDNSDWYSVTGTVIDALDAADAAHSGLRLIGKYKALRKATSKPIAELLREAPRADRKRIAEEMAKFTGEASSRRSFLRLVRQGKIPQLYQVRQIRMEVAKSLLEAANDTTILTTSMLPGRMGETPGVICELVVSTLQEN